MANPWEKYQAQSSVPWEKYKPEIPESSRSILEEDRPGYLKQTGMRLLGQIKTMYDAWKRGDLEEMTGLTALMNQYDIERLRERTDNFRNPAAFVLENIPFIGPSITEMTDKIGQGDMEGAGAVLTADILPALATKRSVESVPKIGPKLKRGAAKSYRRVLEPTSDLALIEAERLAPRLATERIRARSRASLQQQAQKKMAEFGPKTQTAFEGAPAVDWAELNNKLEGVREKHVYIKGTDKVPSNRQSLSKLIDDIQEDLFDLANEQGNVPQQILDNFIDDLNQGLVNTRGDYPVMLSPKSKARITKASARALREYLDSRNPSAAGINSIYSLYAKLEKFTESSRRARIKSEGAVRKGSAKGFGALVEKHTPRLASKSLETIAHTFNSVPWNTVSGAFKDLIADAIVREEWNKISNVLSSVALIKSQPSSEQIKIFQSYLEKQ